MKIRLGYYYCKKCKRIVIIYKGQRLECEHCGSKELRFVNMDTL